ncbi:hypothetical protein M1D49_23020 [Bacillus sp. PK3-056]|uniref:hypothetical protein n=1 Tax=Niallia circulans TaxID=1397 RepID=UPI000F45B8C0|nr:hypothetical protein [Niallia circulans]AYV72437.1 hypothetical protein C2H98_13095 [Niallia circulans]
MIFGDKTIFILSWLVDFDNCKPLSISMDDWKKWRSVRNKLPNLHLREGRNTGSKDALRLFDYFNDMNDQLKERFHVEAIIKEGVSLALRISKNFMKSARNFLQ